MTINDPWAELERLTEVELAGVVLRAGARVRLHPGGRADIFDLALDGQTAIVESIENSYDDEIYLAVVLENDPGKDLGLDRQVGHRFFFRLSEVEPIP